MSYAATDDTIAAIASPPGGALRGILRLSGVGVEACLARCFEPASGGGLAGLQRAAVIDGVLQLDALSRQLPCRLYYWPGSRSYTRQPSAELHTLGSPPLLQAALRSLLQAGSRLAQPGEFTMRAFLSGQLGLTQAEAVLGVIDAVNQRELQVALTQLAGGLETPLQQTKNDLLDLLADLEAGLDFVEEDIDFIAPQDLLRRLQRAADVLNELASQMAARSVQGAARRVALTGWTNVGKSSLLNALAGEKVALTADAPGVTRDYLEHNITCNGFTATWTDTAGALEQQPEDSNPPQLPAVRPAIAEAAEHLARRQTDVSHLKMLCLDATRPLNAWEKRQIEQPSGNRILVLTKCDAARRTDLTLPAMETSARTGAGLEELQRQVRAALEGSPGAEGVVSATAARCEQSVQLAVESLLRARQLAAAAMGEELVAAEVRVALEELGQVLGQIVTDDILDRVFSRFCIGK